MAALEKKRFIAVAGNIGTGKTTLTTLLAHRYDWQPHFEVVAENPYLADFYADMPRWSLQLQVYFLSKRFQAHQAIANSKISAIQDRSIYEDAHIFARALRDSGTMEPRDYENYFELYSTMLQFLQPPDLVIYVKRSIPRVLERIAQRGRDYEKAIPEAYLRQLDHCYEDWIRDYRLGKVLTVNADDLDLVERPKDLDYVCEQLESALAKPGPSFSC